MCFSRFGRQSLLWLHKNEAQHLACPSVIVDKTSASVSDVRDGERARIFNGADAFTHPTFVRL